MAVEIERVQISENGPPYQGIIKEVDGMSERQLIHTLSGGKIVMDRLLSTGSRYVRTESSEQMDMGGPTIAYFAHPSDRKHLAHSLDRASGSVIEHIFTPGGLGIDEWPPEMTIPLRKQGSVRSAARAEIQLVQGEYPDGNLSTYIDHAAVVTAKEIQENEPSVIIVHSFTDSHDDHWATRDIVQKALELLEKEGRFRRGLRKPALYETDPDGGIARKNFGRFDLELGPGGIVLPGAIVPINIDTKMADLFEDHWDQMYQDPPEQSGNIFPSSSYKPPERSKFKHYVREIPMRNRLLGQQIEEIGGGRWADGFTQIHIPGITSHENRLVRLHQQVYQLEQAA